MYHSISKRTLLNWKGIFLYIIVSLFLIFEMAVQVSPGVMANDLMHDLQISAFELGIMSSFYFYTYAIMQIPSGLLFDRYHPRHLITGSILICSTGILIFALASNVYYGSLARLLMGLGSAFAFVSVLVITAELFSAKYFAMMTGMTQMLAALGAMGGGIPINKLVASIGWRQTFYILFVIGIILALLVWKCLQYDRRTVAKYYAPNPLSSLKSILTQSQTWYIALYACLLWAPMSSFASLWGVPFLMKVHHLNSADAAYFCSLMWLGLAVASPIVGMVSSMLELTIAPLILTALTGIISFSFILGSELSPILLGFCLFFAGAACSGQALSFTLIKNNNPPAMKGTAIAFNNMAVVLSGALFQPLLGKLINLNDSTQFKNAISVILFCYVAAFTLAVLALKKEKIRALTAGYGI